MIPDIDLLLPGYRTWHAFTSVLILLPLTIVGVIFFDTILAPRLAQAAQQLPQRRVTHLLRYFGLEAWDHLASKRFTPRWLIKAIYSTIIGISTHFLLDLPTHDWFSYLRPFSEGPMPPWFLYTYGVINIPLLGPFTVTRARIVWWIFTVILGIIAVYCLRYMKTHQLLSRWYKS